MNKSLCKTYAHIGSVTAIMIMAIVIFLLLKATQRWNEIRVDEGANATTIRRALSEGLVRRADDPSVWALAAAAIAGWLVVRAATSLVRAVPDADLRWLPSLRGMGWWLLASGLSISVYLGITRVKHEGFWYELKPGHAKYLETPIPFLQDIEASLNLICIIAATSLFPLAMRILQLLKAHAPTAPDVADRNLRSCTASLASVALFPVLLLVLVALYHQLIRVIFGHPFGDALLDFLTGSFGALLICWPMVVISWIAWSYRDRFKLRLNILKNVHVPIWLVLAVGGKAGVVPPAWVMHPDLIAHPSWRSAYQIINEVGWLGSIVCMWYDAP